MFSSKPRTKRFVSSKGSKPASPNDTPKPVAPAAAITAEEDEEDEMNRLRKKVAGNAINDLMAPVNNTHVRWHALTEIILLSQVKRQMQKAAISQMIRMADNNRLAAYTSAVRGWYRGMFRQARMKARAAASRMQSSSEEFA